MDEQILVEFDKAAFKHDISRDDILHAFQYYYYDGPVKGEGYEDKYLRLGVDRSGNLLEIVYHEIDENTALVFHAMKCQSKYYPLLNL
jgi:hypothetical protein